MGTLLLFPCFVLGLEACGLGRVASFQGRANRLVVGPACRTEAVPQLGGLQIAGISLRIVPQAGQGAGQVDQGERGTTARGVRQRRRQCLRGGWNAATVSVIRRRLLRCGIVASLGLRLLSYIIIFYSDLINALFLAVRSNQTTCSNSVTEQGACGSMMRGARDACEESGMFI